MKKLTIDVTGMHCKSCELLLEKSLQKIEGVEKARASQSKGTVEISYDRDAPDMNIIESAIEKNGYRIGKESRLPWLHSDPKKYAETAVMALAIVGIYALTRASGVSFGSVGDFSSPTLGVAFLVGLTAGVSSCMALVGGLVLGIGAKWNKEHVNTSKWHRFEPHLYFNIGRVIGFGILGGLLGLFGSFVSLSPLAIGSITIASGAVMLLLGINLTELSPRLSKVSVTLPKFLGVDIDKRQTSKHIWAISAGALTFFLPCGFTLAMQTYAITTWSFSTGALTMIAFALGTAPGLLGVGGLTSSLSGAWSKRFFRFTGISVLMLALFNISNGYTLMSLGNVPNNVAPATQTTSDEVQEIRMTEGDGGYSPREFHIKPNTKTRWIVNATNPYSCASQLTAPSIGVSRQLEPGENVIEFVSPASGTIRFSCSMGMYSGKIIVDGAGPRTNVSSPATDTVAVSNSSAGNGYSCPMMPGTKR